jgi:HEAT repeat protein
MTEKLPSRMVKVMPNQNSSLPQESRAAATVVAAALLIVCASGTAHAALQAATSDDGFSWYYVTLLMIPLLIGLIIYKRKRDARAVELIVQPKAAVRSPVRKSVSSQGFDVSNGATFRLAPTEPAVFEERRSQALEGAQVWEKPQTFEPEPSVFGAYRIDQEVGKLALGKPHRMDVMASRSTDDRRAIEASLVKVIDSSESGEDGCRRARQALEEYGFVARHSAMMLMGRDAWERSSAARALGQIGSTSSLAFLIEGLHDADSVVRNQAVSSLGELKMPAAIGALLDIARRHPDIPASLLSETLSACSVESLGYLDAPSSEPAMLGDGHSSADLPELASFMSFEDLPAGNEDATLADALTRLEDPDIQVRTQVVRELASHPVQRAVLALTALALHDPNSGIRSAAVTGLGSIDHESVFAPVLIALADDSREVRAAAARTLTGFHFDRADAYVRVMETADPDTLKTVAQACIKTGIVGQAVDRLASEDRHQAYEAFSLFSMLAKANETQPILDAIANHKDDEVRLCAVRVLNVAAQPDLAPTLREMISREGMPANVRTALLEVMYKLDREQPVFDPGASDNSAVSLHNSP